MTRRNIITALIIAGVALILLSLANNVFADDYHSGSQSGTNYGTGQYYNPNASYYGMHSGGYGSGTHTYDAVLTGAKEVPPVNTNTHGVSGVWFRDNGVDMNYWLSIWNGDEITSAHLHCGDPGEAGPIVVGLYSDPSGTDVNGSLASGNIGNANIQNSASGCTSTIGYAIHNVGDLARAITEGRIYANAHSQAYPDGVARGQLERRSDSGYCGSGTNQQPCCGSGTNYPPCGGTNYPPHHDDNKYDDKKDYHDGYNHHDHDTYKHDDYRGYHHDSKNDYDKDYDSDYNKHDYDYSDYQYKDEQYKGDYDEWNYDDWNDNNWNGDYYREFHEKYNYDTDWNNNGRTVDSWDSYYDDWEYSYDWNDWRYNSNTHSIIDTVFGNLRNVFDR